MRPGLPPERPLYPDQPGYVAKETTVEDAVLAERGRCLRWIELWDPLCERWRDMPMDPYSIKQRIITNIKSGLVQQ